MASSHQSPPPDPSGPLFVLKISTTCKISTHRQLGRSPQKKDSPRSRSKIEETKTPTCRDRGVKSRRKVYHLQKLQNGPMTDHDPMTSFSIVSFPGHREESSHSPYWPLQQVFRGQRTPTELSKSPLELHSLSKVYHFPTSLRGSSPEADQLPRLNGG